MAFVENFIGSFQERFRRLTDDNKRRIVLVCTMVIVVFLALSVVLPLRSSGKTRESQSEMQRMNVRAAIPPHEIFLPNEPDFLPGVLLEREKRSVWTEQDAIEHWQDPLRYGEEQWRNMIETAINELLERIP